MNNYDTPDLCCRIGDVSDNGNNPMEVFFNSICQEVLNKLHHGLHDESLGLNKIHPRELSAVVITNIIVNIFFNTIECSCPRKTKLMFQDLLMRICALSIESFDVLQAHVEEVKH